jgi:hypothetical protein
VHLGETTEPARRLVREQHLVDHDQKNPAAFGL